MFKYRVVKKSTGWTASRHKTMAQAEKSLKHYLRFSDDYEIQEI